MVTQIEMQYMEAVKKIAHEMSKPKMIDWEQRRWELVCNITQGLMAGGRRYTAAEIIRMADAIIAEVEKQHPL